MITTFYIGLSLDTQYRRFGQVINRVEKISGFRQKIG